MRPARSLSELFTFGGRVPSAVGGLICAIVAASLLGALGRGYGLLDVAVLVPGLVWRGQVWRLVTWVFFETSPLNLLFGALTLFWFGRDLCYAWGPRRFLGTFFGISVAAALATCLLAQLVWPALLSQPWTGMWSAILGLIVAWTMMFPERQMLFMMALPLTGRALLWVTLGGSVLFAIFYGVSRYVPELSAELLMLAYARGWSLRGFWQTLRIRQYERRARRKAAHLKVVRKEDPPRWLN